MQLQTDQITARFLEMLPRDNDYIIPTQLLNHGFPGFLVKRIQHELEKHLKKSLDLSDNEWIDPQDDTVSAAIDVFIDEVSPSLRLPLSFAQSVIHKAVADLLVILTEPRARLTGFIFNGEKQLSYDRIISRCSRISVYRHFCNALPRFMEKKGYEELTEERCSHFIAALDEKLLSRYTPENWQKLFEPWFVLMGPELDSALLRQFFADKGENEIANAFGSMRGPVPKATMIEIIINGGDIDDEIAAPLHQTREKPIRLKEEISEETISDAVKDTEEYESTSIVELARRNQTEASSLIHQSRELNPEEKFDVLFSRFQRPDEEASDDDNEIPIWQRYAPDEPEEETEEVEELEEAEALEPEQDEDEQRVPVSAVPAEPVEDTKEPEPVEPSEPEEDEIISFAPKEPEPPKPAYTIIEKPSPVSDEPETEYVPINEQFNNNVHEDEPTSDTGPVNPALVKHLEINQEYFVDNLFGGDEEVYLEVLEELESCKNWKSVVRFLTEDVFRRNFIDIYSEPAVDFTDMLQEYFTEKS